MEKKESQLKKTTKRLSTESGTLTDPKSELLSLLESTSSDSVLVLKSSILEVLLVQLALMFLMLSETKEFSMQSNSLLDVEEILLEWPRREPMWFQSSKMPENHGSIDSWLRWSTLFSLMLPSQTKLELSL